MITRVLLRYGLIAINQKDWERIKSVQGTSLSPQLYRVTTSEGNAKPFHNQFDKALAYEAFCMNIMIKVEDSEVEEECAPTQKVTQVISQDKRYDTLNRRKLKCEQNTRERGAKEKKSKLG